MNSSISTSLLCTCQLRSKQGLSKKCTITHARATAIVLSLIASFFMVTGLFLLLSGIGTIPSLSVGSTLLLSGLGLCVGSFFRLFKSS